MELFWVVGMTVGFFLEVVGDCQSLYDYYFYVVVGRCAPFPCGSG